MDVRSHRVNRAAAAALVLAATLSVASAGTRVVVYSAWSGDALRRDLVVTTRVSGSCWIHSLTSGRADAWRCFSSQSEIFDPCMAAPSGTAVACPEAPFSNRVVVLQLMKRLDAVHEQQLSGKLADLRLKGEPWGLQLTGGAICQFVSGATGMIAGMRLNYACRNGWVIGLPDRSSATWKASFVSSRKDTKPRNVGIDAATF
jgi:hypothetical protein